MAAAVALVTASAGGAACGGVQSALNPSGPGAEAIARLWWVMLGAAAAVFAGVLLLLAIALTRARGHGRDAPLTARTGWMLVLAGGVVLPIAALLPLVVASAYISRSIAAPPPPDALVVEIVGHQWWWEMNYLDGDTVIARSPNELRVPARRPVHLRLRSADVIHSFWVPNLTGKVDLIPGQTNVLTFSATGEGAFRGQCAEFCGGPHALMAFEVVVEPPERFAAWLARQQQPARPPDDSVQARGLETFLAGGCADCHRIAGTRADGRFGPDLTHVGGRRHLAAATLPNTIGHLGGWILDPQSNKPGAKMPPTSLQNPDFASLLAYLRSLQ